MIINPTKKAQALFSALPKVTDAQRGKSYSLTNPFFSWHANYYNSNRKKILVLVNDLTMIPVVIADVNAKNKKELAEEIRIGIKQTFKQEGISEQDIHEYLKLAGEIEINSGFNRQVTGVTTMFIQSAALHPIDFSQRVQPHLMKWLADTPIQRLPEKFPCDALKKAIQNHLKILPIDENTTFYPKKKVETEVQMTWKSFSEWDKYPNEGWFEGYEEAMEEMSENNQVVLASFQEYLSNGLGLSDKVVRRHTDYTESFLNYYLTYYGIHTPITDFSDAYDCLSDFFPRKGFFSSPAGVRQAGAALKKFYDFLALANVITTKELKEVKENISDGVEMGEECLEMMEW